MANEKQTGGNERGGSGNFANDRDKASEAGKKGGEKSQGGGWQKPPDRDRHPVPILHGQPHHPNSYRGTSVPSRGTLAAEPLQ